MILQYVVGKVVDASEQTISTTYGSVSTGSVAGAGGVVYGGGGGGSVSTQHRTKSTWKIFTVDEEVATFDHYTEITAEVGDIVVMCNEGNRTIGIFNLTDDIYFIDVPNEEYGTSRFWKAFMITSALALGILWLSIGDALNAGIELFILLLLFVLSLFLWPLTVLANNRVNRAKSEKIKARVNDFWNELGSDIESSIQKKKQRLREI